jgi:glycine cleavage system P protein (glycine dehydrogenase) subunit 2
MNYISKRVGLTWREPLIFEKISGCELTLRFAGEDHDPGKAKSGLPKDLVRKKLPRLPCVNEREVAKHYTRLSSWNFGLDHGFYPLGSCTMKYNPKVNEYVAGLPGFRDVHPEQSPETAYGALKLMMALRKMLEEISGMHRVCLQPAAGAQGELTGMLMVRAYHNKKGNDKKVVLIPDTAHGTNPSSSNLAGYEVKEIPTGEKGTLGVDTVLENLNDEVAALMMTNPNTIGLFEKDILKIADALHAKDALLYCDGANMNAIMGITRPGDMGVDVIQFNLHKTFSTPHGGGGPGSGPVGISEKLEPFLPVPVIDEDEKRTPVLLWDRPDTIGEVMAYYGHFLVMVKAYAYLARLSAKGVRRVSETALLNANYLRVKLKNTYHLTHPDECMHEAVFSDKNMANGVTTMDVAKRLMDYGYHPPTIYFPLVISGALMIEPTETETKETLDNFVSALKKIAKEASENPDLVKNAPHSSPLSRLDEVLAARKPKLKYDYPDPEKE